MSVSFPDHVKPISQFSALTKITLQINCGQESLLKEGIHHLYTLLKYKIFSPILQLRNRLGTHYAFSILVYV
jgi:hypothetical protein